MIALENATVSDVLSGVVRRLREAGVEDAPREARRILDAGAGITAEDLLRDPRRPMTPDARDRIDAIAARRAAGEPLSRIVGLRNFYGRDFVLGPETLDPRADTEIVVEAAIDRLRDRKLRNPAPRILDIGTGTGCIAITLCLEVDGVHGVALDISNAAVEIARRNAEAHGVSRKLDILAADGPALIEGPFDLVISNPPYIPSGDIGRLDANVRDHDPRRALDGGADGLAFYRAWIPEIARRFPAADVVFEVGAGQADGVAALLSRDFAGKIQMRRDLGGHVRCVAASPVNL